MRIITLSIGLAACTSVVPVLHAPLGAQAPANPAFDVASVKPNASRTAVLPDGGLGGGTNVSSTAGRFTAQNAGLVTLVSLAYGIPDFRISGGPQWIRTERFDVDAKAETIVDEATLMVLLRSLLAQRFDMTLRQDMKELPAHVLLLAKKGPRPQPIDATVDGDSARRRLGFMPDETVAGSTRRFRISGVASMDQLAAFLGTSVRGPVVNETGLVGTFDINVTWTSDTFAMALKGRERDAGAGLAPVLAPIDADLASAMQTQLGLRFETKKRMLETLVIERAARPSSN